MCTIEAARGASRRPPDATPILAVSAARRRRAPLLPLPLWWRLRWYASLHESNSSDTCRYLPAPADSLQFESRWADLDVLCLRPLEVLPLVPGHVTFGAKSTTLCGHGFIRGRGNVNCTNGVCPQAALTQTRPKARTFVAESHSRTP